MRMVERPVAVTEPRRAGDRALDVISGTIDRALDAETLGDAGCDSRGEGAAGPVGVAGRDPRALPDLGAAGGDEDIRDGFSREMAALDQHCSAAEREQGLARGPHLGPVANR